MQYDNDGNITVIRPRLGGRAKREKLTSVNRLKSSLMHAKNGQSRSFTPHQINRSRRVIVKAKTITMKGKGSLKATQAHLKYLERDGVDKDGTKGELYGKDDSFQREDFAKEINNEERQYRFIVSPEEGERLDLQKFTRELMEKVEEDLHEKYGTENLEWTAVNHYNTDHPHVHIVIRGIDSDGNKVEIPREYQYKQVRHHAQEIVTRELGLRSDQEIEAQHNKEIHSNRYTGLDKTIKGKEENRVVSLERESTFNKTLRSRLDHLSSSGLAQRLDDGSYRMLPGWDETLKKNAQVQEIKERIHEAVHGNAELYKINDIPKEGIRGKVIKKGMTNDFHDKPYAIIQDAGGVTHYIEINQYQNESIHKNDFVSIKQTEEHWVKTADNIIDTEAKKNNGIYNPDIHKESIEGDTVRLKTGKIVSKDDFVSALENRLESLQRLGISEKKENGEWKVDDKLLDKLNDIEREKGTIKKIHINKESSQTLEEQISYKGRTWLDRYTDKPLESISHDGVGAELRPAIRRRMIIMQELGIDPHDPARAKKLDTIEKNSIAEPYKEKGYRYKGYITEGSSFQGTLRELPEMPNGNKYGQVLNEKSKEFTLVPWKKEYDMMKNKTIELAHQSGRFSVKEITRELQKGIVR